MIIIEWSPCLYLDPLTSHTLQEGSHDCRDSSVVYKKFLHLTQVSSATKSIWVEQKICRYQHCWIALELFPFLFLGTPFFHFHFFVTQRETPPSFPSKSFLLSLYPSLTALQLCEISHCIYVATVCRPVIPPFVPHAACISAQACERGTCSSQFSRKSLKVSPILPSS